MLNRYRTRLTLDRSGFLSIGVLLTIFTFLGVALSLSIVSLRVSLAIIPLFLGVEALVSSYRPTLLRMDVTTLFVTSIILEEIGRALYVMT
ncbi:MAG: hypothetical protein ABSF00_01350 [Candidatus Bathyarchaeia archaeon]